MRLSHRRRLSPASESDAVFSPRAISMHFGDARNFPIIPYAAPHTGDRAFPSFPSVTKPHAQIHSVAHTSPNSSFEIGEDLRRIRHQNGGVVRVCVDDAVLREVRRAVVNQTHPEANLRGQARCTLSGNFSAALGVHRGETRRKGCRPIR